MPKIILDKQDATYTAGESVSGVVVVPSNVTKRPTSIRIKFEGRAAVNWPVVQRTGQTSHYYTTCVTDEEIYFVEEITVLQSGSALLYFIFSKFKYVPSYMMDILTITSGREI
ncbi:Arrestin domain-containing protein 5 [Folsomia candida]|uniref:Arrestin domain-containing protein 5 n=1 Tax=Folsomia candida TaxID=158441 RepID=A0A226EW41_FOLCA|nr:Arrestin domain-containing protein 5 [Folsomia candida]